jgi:tripartite-type tricarboxylate transporter receptor subunit TctC
MRTTHLAGLLAIGAIFTVQPAVAQSAWQPTRPVEFIVTSGTGGGTDVFARTVQAAIQRNELVRQPIVVTNKGAGSGAEGYVYARGVGADPHKVVFGTTNAWLLPLVARVGFRYQDFQPVGALALDEFMLWAKADGPYRTAADLIAAARTRPGEVRMAGSQTHDTDQTLTAMVQRAAGVRFTYVPFRGGGEAGVQLAGGHVDSNTNNPSESIGGWRGGQVRPLCVFRRDRMPAGDRVTESQGWHDIPTCREQGIAVDEFRMARTVWLNAAAPAAARAYWTDVMRRVSETPEFRDYIQRTSQTGRFMDPEELRTYAVEDERVNREVFAAEGWLVN